MTVQVILNSLDILNICSGGLMPIAQLGLAAGSPVALDHVFLVVLVLVSPLVDWLWLYPRLIRATTAGVPGARERFYFVALVMQWGFAVCAIALWAARGRSWAALGLGVGTPLKLGIGLALA